MPSNHSKNNETLKVNRKVWNDMINEKQGNGYSFTKKNGFVCGSLNHLIKDCDYYEKKIAREAEEHPLKNMVNRGIFANSGCQGAHDSNRYQLKDFENSMGDLFTFEVAKAYIISGKGLARTYAAASLLTEPPFGPEAVIHIPVSLENQANNAGTSEETNSAGTSQTPESIASEEKDKEVELIVVWCGAGGWGPVSCQDS
ncbi:hypothetical protein Tco_0677061 [Tanacetum coccineum]